MAPPCRDSFPSDHDDLLRYSSSDHLFFPTTPQASSSSSSLSFPLFPALDHSNSDILDPPSLQLKQHEGGGIMACNNDQSIGNDEDVETGLRFTIWKQIDKSESSSCCENNNNNNTHNDLVKWSSSSSSSSKIRLVINSNQTETATQMLDGGPNFQDLNRTSPSPSQPNQINKRSSTLNDGGAIVRTCSDCNTTKTPLWRSGPRGPKSLCNACGIRQRKARRAMAEAAAAAANGGIPCGGKPTTGAAVVLKTNNKAVQHKIMTKSPATTTTTLKRKCKDDVDGGGGGGGGGRKKLCFEDIKMGGRLSEISSSYQRVFPQDEREAAILLMTLSYGLLHG